MNDPEFSSNPYQAPTSEPEFIEPEFHGGNPLLTIWVRPRATLRHILNTDPRRGVLLLAMLQGVGQAFAQAALTDMGDKFSTGQIVAICLIAGPFIGLTSLYISGALLRWTGSWLGGRGTSEDVRAALAWSYVPSICSLILLIPEYALLGREIFTSETPRLGENPALALVVMGIGIVEMILRLWSVVLALKCLGEAHRFSSGKALGTILLGGLVLIVLLFPLFLFLFVVMPAIMARVGR